MQPMTHSESHDALEGALLPVLRFRRSGSVYATRLNLLGAAPSQDTG